HPPGQSGVHTADPLAELAWQYGERLARIMIPIILKRAAVADAPTAGQPTPEETLLWYQLRIYMKVVRALVARAAHARRDEAADPRGCGKLALVSIDRSLDALAQLHNAVGTDETLELQQMLIRLRDGLESRVPGARAFIRIGLDQPVAYA